VPEAPTRIENGDSDETPVGPVPQAVALLCVRPVDGAGRVAHMQVQHVGFGVVERVVELDARE
jgi:hypothetical protein